MIMGDEANRCIDNCAKLVERDRQVMAPFSRIHYYPFAVKKGRGAIVEDIDGNEYIDFFSSAAVLNTGHSHPVVVDAIKKQSEDFVHYTTAYMYNDAQVELAERLVQITPGSFKKRVAFGLTGSDANDGAIKLARAYTGRKTIISFLKAYHGSTYGSMSVSAISLNMRRKIGPMLGDVHHLPYPDCYRCPLGHEREVCSMECIKLLEDAFETHLPPDDVAAVIMEPIAGDAGIIMPPMEYVKRLHELCQKHGILFVSEEVQQGFGRSGKWFGIEHFGIEPDIIVMGKAIASGLPLSALVARSEIMESLAPPAHIFTMGGNPVCCSAGAATVDVIRAESLVEKSRELGKHAMMKFQELSDKYEIIGDVRGAGLSIAVDLVTDRVSRERNREAATKISYRCWQKGLILTFFAGNVLRVQPPLVITIEELERGIDILEKVIEEYLDGRISDSVLDESKGW